MRMETTASTQSWRQWSLRLLLGGLLLASGLGKGLDETGFVDVLRTYQLGLPDAALWLLAIGVTAVETVVGLLILSGRRLRMAARLALAINFAYFVVLTATLWRGLELDNCGCFGVYAARPLRWYSPLEDLVLMGLSWLLIRFSRQSDETRVRADTPA